METSSHCIISEKDLNTQGGEVIYLVPENNIAYHAGVSFWNGEEKINQISIGIEHVNDGKSQFNQSQIKSSIDLSKKII